MRRNRILILLAVLVATSTAVFWLGNVLNVLANVAIEVNGLTINVSEQDFINDSRLLANDPDASGTITYTLNTVPANGDLVISNTGGITTLLPISQFLQTDIDNNFLVYAHGSGTEISDTFDFTVTSTIDEITATFPITINQPPTIIDGSLTITENVAIGTFVGTSVTSDANTPNDSFSYTIQTSEPSAAFAIGSSSGNITVNNSGLLNFETTPTFTLTVQVEDSGLLTDSAQIVIDLIDANDPPVLTPAGPFSLPENSATNTPVGTPISASDEDAGASLAYSITDGNTGTAFAINPSSGQITVANGSLLDFETPPTSYNLTIRVDDNAGGFDTELVTINLTNVNEPPVLDNFTIPTPLPENSNSGVNVGTVPTPTDPDAGETFTYAIISGNPGPTFNIGSSDGIITVASTANLDFETMPTYNLTIEVEDSGGEKDTAIITINLDDVNEQPTVNDNSFSIDENSGNTTLVGIVTASDPDEDDIGSLIFDILSGDSGGAFTISNDGSNNGRITVADSSQLDYETTQSFMLGIIVTDIEGLEGTANVTVNINNLFDEPPTVNNATFNVSEGSTNGVVVGTVTATDPETVSGDALTFSITGGNTGTVFAINSTSGQITVPDTSKLDADAMPTFNLTIRAIDKGGQIDTGIITINVSTLPITYLYLPVLMNDYPPIEPNNNCTQAYGIGSGTDYTFIADDQEDWYAITLNSASNLTAIVSSFEPSDGQLIMYGGTCTPSGNQLILLGNNGDPSTTKTLNLGTRPAGTYYIRVYSVPATNTSYTLRVNIN